MARDDWAEDGAHAGIARLSVRGHFHRGIGERLGQRILDLVARAEARDVVVDLSGVDSMVVHAVVPVVGAARRLRGEGRRISVVVDPALTLFAATGLDQLYDVALSCEDAVTRLVRSAALRDDATAG